MVAVPLEERGVEETLDALERLHQTRVIAEAGMFELAAHFADLHNGDTLAGVLPGGRVPGAERSVRLGGVGTPQVAEFAGAELGARMQLGPVAAQHYLADALDVRHRLPRIWAKIVSRQAQVGRARLVAFKTRHLSLEAAGLVDAAMVDYLDGCLPRARFEARLDGKVKAADPQLAVEREAARMAEQCAKRTHGSVDGTAGFYVHSGIGVIARIDGTIAFVAEALRAFGDTDPDQERRVKALLILCNPTKAVELLAAYTALRATSLDVELPEPPPPPENREPPGSPGSPGSPFEPVEPAGPVEQPVDGLARMDAFARRIGFTPTRLPAWLTARAAAPPGQDPPGDSPPDGSPPSDGPPGQRPPGGSSPGGSSPGGSPPGGSPPGVPGFVFDWSKLLPPLTLYLHASVESLAAGQGGVVRWEGEGPITEQFVHDHLRPIHDYVIQPVIDPAGMAPVDGYEIPDRHRTAVKLRNPADGFPYAAAVHDRVDVDHTEEYEPDAETEDAGRNRAPQTRMDNLAGLARFSHRIKTHGHWTLRQPFDGILVWRDPHGQIYLVDHTGTHKITTPGHRAGNAADRHHPSIDVYPTDIVIETDFRRPA